MFPICLYKRMVKNPSIFTGWHNDIFTNNHSFSIGFHTHMEHYFFDLFVYFLIFHFFAILPHKPSHHIHRLICGCRFFPDMDRCMPWNIQYITDAFGTPWSPDQSKQTGRDKNGRYIETNFFSDPHGCVLLYCSMDWIRRPVINQKSHKYYSFLPASASLPRFFIM